MKKILIAVVVLSCVLLCACREATSIGIIGGADEPASIMLDGCEGQVQSEISPVRVIKAGGEVYYDSGITNNVPRCGNLDGSLKKTVGAYELPQNDGESNFEPESDYFGYQSCTSITKDVLVDGNWVVFKKVTPVGDYKYCFKIKGTHPNAAKASEYIVFANTTDITFEQITKYFFSSQLQDHQLDIQVVHPNVYDEWGITMYAENVTPKGVTVCCEQFGGNLSGELQTGAAYTLEVFEDDKWVEVETKTGEPLVWNSIAYSIQKNELTKWDVNFEHIYNDLQPGTYRVGKNVMDFRAAGDYDQKTYYAEFKITG